MDFRINIEETNGTFADQYQKTPSMHRCFAGICMYSSMSNKLFLESYIPWLIQNTQEVCITVGDYLERHNLSIFKDVNIAQAAKLALEKGKRIHRYLSNVLCEHKGQSTVTFLDWHKLTQDLSFQKRFFKIKEYSYISELFDNDVISQVKEMLKRTKRLLNFDKKIGDEEIEVLKQYVFEELAYFITMYEMKYYIEIYPGKDLVIMKNIINCKYEDFPFNLKDRTHIGLNPIRVRKLPTDDFKY